MSFLRYPPDFNTVSYGDFVNCGYQPQCNPKLDEEIEREQQALCNQHQLYAQESSNLQALLSRRSHLEQAYEGAAQIHTRPLLQHHATALRRNDHRIASASKRQSPDATLTQLDALNKALFRHVAHPTYATLHALEGLRSEIYAKL